MLRALLITGFFAAAGGLAPALAAAETRLLMAEEQGCIWCARWTREIGQIYPKTIEGQTAPLERYDLHSESPDVDFARGVFYTPTFILVKDGREMSRIEGYPGEDFFWGLLGQMLADAEIPLAPALSTEPTLESNG